MAGRPGAKQLTAQGFHAVVRAMLRPWLGLFLAVVPSLASAADCQARTTWPAPDWETPKIEATQARVAAVKALDEYMFTLRGADADRQGIRTDSVLVLKSGQVVYERYARGYDATKRHLAWSVSKSFTNALAGRAIALGALGLDDSLCQYLPKTRADNCVITVRHLLDFSSGLDWAEVYEHKSNQESSTLAQLYGEGRADMAAFIANHQRRDPPGTTFEYSTGETTLLMAVVQAALTPKLGRDFAWSALFDPLGLRSAVWERDQTGTLVGGAYLYATPRDFARLGYLFLNDGCWQGQRLLPEGWVRDATAVSEAYRHKVVDRSWGDIQGREWWLNQPVAEALQPVPWPDVPQDAYAAEGHWNQLVLVVPSKDLVVVRTGDDRDERALDYNRFFKLAIEVAR
jgi:CubicO group peptidase (beta-lactamase class C family)